MNHSLTFDHDGAEHFVGALSEEMCREFDAAFATAPLDVPGIRFGELPALRDVLGSEGIMGRIAAGAIGRTAMPVRAILFDKTKAANWGLARHQDRTIVVEKRADLSGFGPWTVKSGLIQVEPPFEIIRGMATVRIHLDPVDARNAPLHVIPGSHKLGRLSERAIDDLVLRVDERTCLADRGDVWLYATAIVHGSRAADPPRRRRVLQIDYSAASLPEPLRWRGL